MRVLLIIGLLLAAACAPDGPQAPAGESQVAEAEADSDADTWGSTDDVWEARQGQSITFVDRDNNLMLNCPASATSTWQGFAIEATSSGLGCAQALATLTIRNIDGAVGHSETFQARRITTLAGAESAADMERRLREWITPSGAAMDSTGDLPPWKAGAEHPGGGEDSAFYPERGRDRAAYEALRRADAPMFCFVEGMERQACWLGENGVISKIGVQRFPG